jgi:hypothetical protein
MGGLFGGSQGQGGERITVDGSVALRGQVSARALLELRRKALDPAVHGPVVDLGPSIGEHALEVAVADRELQVPPDRLEDHRGREAVALVG